MDNPKDLAGIDPCELLTPPQLSDLTFTEPGEKDTSLFGEEACTFSNSNLIVTFEPDTKRRGLEETYQRESNFDNFEESSVDGYPAVRVNFATQICRVAVGVSDDQVLNVDLTRVSGQAPGEGDPCEFAESIASTVLENLPAG